MMNNLLKKVCKYPNLVSAMRGANHLNLGAASQRSLHTPLGSTSSKDESYQVCTKIIDAVCELRIKAESRVS